MASKRHLRRKQCLNKAAHATQDDALIAARKAGRRTGDRIMPYHCPFCHRYHIGHPPRRVLQAIRARLEGKR